MSLSDKEGITDLERIKAECMTQIVDLHSKGRHEGDHFIKHLRGLIKIIDEAIEAVYEKPKPKYIPHTKDTAPAVWEGYWSEICPINKVWAFFRSDCAPSVVCHSVDGSGSERDFKWLFEHYIDKDGNPYGQLVEGGES